MSKSRPRFGGKSRSFLELLATLAFAAILFSLPNTTRSLSETLDPSLLITEVYPAARSAGTSLETHEWIELRNLGRYPLNLGEWVIEDSQAIARLPELDLAPGMTVLVVGRSARVAVPAGKTLIILDTPRIGSGLRNAGDRVALVDPDGVRRDAVSWGDVRSPRHMDPPEQGQSIVRNDFGAQRLSDLPTPWTDDTKSSDQSLQHRHPKPDTRVRINSARVDPTEDQPESVTIENISDEPLLTINWRLTVGASTVRVRSVRIPPGETLTIADRQDRLGSGLGRSGGHLILRDGDGNWLATASWGDDDTFHRLPPADESGVVLFNPLNRVWPGVHHDDQLNATGRFFGLPEQPVPSLNPEDASLNLERETGRHGARQEPEGSAIWISEVHPAAGQGRNDAAYEWFELTNSGDAKVDLSGWTIADNRSSDPLDGLIIPPGATVAIGVSPEAAPEILPLISDGRIGNGLANAGDRLTLINPEGEVVSAVSWGNDRTYTIAKAPTPEESVHRPSPSAQPIIAAPSPGELTQASPPPTEETTTANESPNGESGASTERAGPGSEPAGSAAPMSTPAVSLRITELMPAPRPGEAEWVEIFNPNNVAIDLTGWTIGDLARHTPLSGTIPPRSYLVVATAPLEGAAPVLIVARIGNSLNNDADTVVLADSQGEVRFSISYGTDDIPAPATGLSLALQPERWVITAVASPGSADVVPLLDDAFRSPTVRPAAEPDERLPLVPEPPQQGLNAWMIVSFALIGVIFTLIVRRWQPEPGSSEEPVAGAAYSGPPPESPGEAELERRNDGRRE